MKYFSCRLRIRTIAVFFILCTILFLWYLTHLNSLMNEHESIEGIPLTIRFDEKDYFFAAVVEYALVQTQNGVQSTLELNLRRYLSIVKECHQHNVDIIIFPEGGLFGYSPLNRRTAFSTAVHVPSAADSVVPCWCENCDKDILRNLSCAAIESKVYLAVTLLEKFSANASESSFENSLLFITAVVFDRNGMIIARYRKYNLYMEKWQFGINTTEQQEIITFTTDFDVKFGIMICFDYAFQKPAIELVRKYNATHIIHPMQMLSTLPFMPVSAAEAGWSYAMDTFLLASSVPNPIYTLGSGIYFGRRQDTRTYVKNHQSSKIIISPVPKHRSVKVEPYPQTFSNLEEYTPGKPRQKIFLVEHIFNSMTKEPISKYKTQSTASFSYINRTFECNINVTWKLIDESDNFPNYQLMAYSGPNNHSLAAINHYSEMCGLALCSNMPAVSCLLPPHFEDSSKVSIVSLEISAVSYYRHGTMVPTAYDSNLVALNVKNFEFDTSVLKDEDEFIYKVHMKLINPSTNLVAFGIYRFIDKVSPIPVYTVADDLNNKDIIVDLMWWLFEGSSNGNFSQILG